MKSARLFLFIFILSVMVMLGVGCENQARVKGVRERNKLEKEPEIVVKLTGGQEKQMKLEEYITGVVAGEMKKDWPVNAYAAQAIIARTFALKYMSDNKTNVISGSYEFAQEFKPENITQKLADAVSTTRGEVIVYQDDYIKGWFHASAGGQTTSAKVGLAYEKAEPPYIKTVSSPDNMAPEDVQNWTVKFTNAELAEALDKMGKDIGSIESINIDDKDKTGRIVSLTFKGSKGSYTVKAANFRTQLDPKRLKSTKISKIEKEGASYSFSGAGFGHGVGMSQWGAYAMAKDGRLSEEIVSHYFKDIEIVKEYD